MQHFNCFNIHLYLKWIKRRFLCKVLGKIAVKAIAGSLFNVGGVRRLSADS